jgi:hypothetical protein
MARRTAAERDTRDTPRYSHSFVGVSRVATPGQTGFHDHV